MERVQGSGTETAPGGPGLELDYFCAQRFGMGAPSDFGDPCIPRLRRITYPRTTFAIPVTIFEALEGVAWSFLRSELCIGFSPS
jgi:hypothetical protein